MKFDRPKQYTTTSSSEDPRTATVPGKQTLTEGMVQLRAAAPSADRTSTATEDPAPEPELDGRRPTLQKLFSPRGAAADPDHVHTAAARGTATAAAQLPHLAQIQRSFGRHDVSAVQAHTGEQAAASARQMGAHAYATGDHVVLGDQADLHTVAHEAAHVVQQRAGVQLKSGIGEVGDSYERHADAVADRVVAGESAEALLDEHAPRGGDTAGPRRGAQSAAEAAPGAPIQRKTLKLSADRLTEPMIQRFNEAYGKFTDTILADSALARDEHTTIVVYGVSQQSHGTRDFGSTTIYFGNDGYQGDDYTKFTELWQWSSQHELPASVGVRIVIAVNLTANRTIEELYATLLHEWYAHAVKWEGTVNYVRRGQGLFAVPWIQGQGHERRAQGEHIAYANWTDEEVEAKVDALHLNTDQRASVIAKLKSDRDRHDRTTGAPG